MLTTSSNRPWSDVDIPEAVAAVPAMLSVEERRYLIWATAATYQGVGAVVDLGPWLGGSSVALAHGLERSGKPGKVQSFDLFEWNPGYMSEYACELREGDDFQPLFERTTAKFADRIQGHRMDLMQGRWDGGPIEILFVDAAKSWELWRRIVEVFGPALVPGKSRVIHQDFRHPFCPWLPISCDSQPDTWRQTEAVEDGCTVAFRPMRAIRATDAPRLVDEGVPYPTRRALFTARIRNDYPERQAWRYRLALFAEAVRNDDTALAEELAIQLERDRGVDSLADKHIPWLMDDSRCDKATHLCQAGRYLEALPLTRAVPIGSRRDYDALTLTAHAARGLGKLDLAERALQAATSIEPDRAEAKLELLWLRVAQNRAADGEAIARELLRTSATLVTWMKDAAGRGLCHALGHQHRFAEALAVNDTLLETAVNDVNVLTDRARVLLALGRLQEAKKAVSDALARDPGNTQARYCQEEIARTATSGV
jgi:tetratricopeptide (TPR) repeat protein